MAGDFKTIIPSIWNIIDDIDKCVQNFGDAHVNEVTHSSLKLYFDQFTGNFQLKISGLVRLRSTVCENVDGIWSNFKTECSTLLSKIQKSEKAKHISYFSDVIVLCAALQHIKAGAAKAPNVSIEEVDDEDELYDLYDSDFDEAENDDDIPEVPEIPEIPDTDRITIPPPNVTRRKSGDNDDINIDVEFLTLR